MKFPITVTGIKYKETEVFQTTKYGKEVCGQLVKVRPCDEKFEGKTFLGIMLGEMAVSQMAQLKDDGELEISHIMHNPMIFIPERNAVVFGYGSWWGKIKNADELKEITNADISNVWYVKALEQLGVKAAAENPEHDWPWV